uniref:Uncharacterized protein n=1 Tax=Glossina pallidipes TaxID=7398 RepID=A0A1A9ZCZ3_GLOPL
MGKENENENSAGTDILENTLQQKRKMDVNQGEDKAKLTELIGINAVATEARQSSLKFFKASGIIISSIFSRQDSNISGNSNISSSSNTIKEGRNQEFKSSGCHKSPIKVKQVYQNLQTSGLKTLMLGSNKSATTSINNEKPGPSHYKSTTNLNNALCRSGWASDATHYRCRKRFHSADSCDECIPKKKIRLQLTSKNLNVTAKASDSDPTDTEVDESDEEGEEFDVEITLLPSTELNNNLITASDTGILENEEFESQGEVMDELEEEEGIGLEPENNHECTLGNSELNGEIENSSAHISVEGYGAFQWGNESFMVMRFINYLNLVFTLNFPKREINWIPLQSVEERPLTPRPISSVARTSSDWIRQ